MNETQHILIAEDEDDVRELFVRVLTRLVPGAVITAVSNGREALSVLQQQRCDLLLSDQRMPGMTGLELVRAVRHERPQMPVIVISADTGSETALLQAGATAFITKPVTVVQIRELLSRWLS